MHASARFLQWLEATGSPRRIGEVLILGEPAASFSLRHARDRLAPAGALRPILSDAAWRDLVRSAADGSFRPLKAAPNLPSGWRYEGLDFSGLLLALQHLYPAALANWHLAESGSLPVTPWTQTAARQTGRFKIVGRLTSEQLADLIASTCARGCLKCRLWEPRHPPPLKLPPGETREGEPELPLYCPEACNWFVSQARAALKPGSSEEE